MEIVVLSPKRESDPRPSSYQELALPLSHLGARYANEQKLDMLSIVSNFLFSVAILGLLRSLRFDKMEHVLPT